VIESEETVECSDCRRALPPDSDGPCPDCGSTNRWYSTHLTNGVRVSDSVRWRTRREFYKKNRGAAGGVLAVTILGSVIGTVVTGPPGIVAGLALGGMSYWLGPKAKEKWVQIEEGD